MKEVEWAKKVAIQLEEDLIKFNPNLRVNDGTKLPYAFEIKEYEKDGKPFETVTKKYETDILISELTSEGCWIPRVIIECKVKSITTHDSITYSQKAKSHKYIHPYLRYGILVGKRDHYPLPGRLYRHGEYFDFMVSFKEFETSKEEWKNLLNLIKLEIKASLQLEEIIFNSRSSKRKRYTILHRPLILK